MRTGENVTIWHEHLSTILDCYVGNGSVLHSHVWIGNNVVIGDNCRIQAFSFIPDGVLIGNGVFIGPRVTFTNDKHPPSSSWSRTIVEDNVVIGAGAIILPGVTLSVGCMIGAGSVVTHDVPSQEVWVGNPARKLTR